MPGTTDVIRGALKLDNFTEGKAYSNLDSFIKDLSNMFSVEIPENVTNVIVSSSEPGDDFKTGVWIRKDAAGAFAGVYIFQVDSWTKIVPPLFDTEVILMYGNSNDIPSGYSLADDTNPDLPAGVGTQLMTEWVSDGSNYTLFHIVKDTS